MAESQVPAGGAEITIDDGVLHVPDNPIVPYIEGDGIGVDITPVMHKVVDAAVDKAYGGAARFIGWRSWPGRRPTIGPAPGCPMKPSRPFAAIGYPSKAR